MNYREAYGVFACNGILFNHESPVRGENFVTRKVSRAVARISCGLQDCLYIGNLDAKRDWGHARDYVEMQWLMLQQERPKDYVIASGEQHTVRSFIDAAFREVGIELEWQGEGHNETAVDKDGRTVVAVDPRYFRPTEVETLLGDTTLAREELGWQPRTTFDQLVKEMVASDLRQAESERLLRDHGLHS